MSITVPSKSSPILFSSQKEVINRSDNSVVINNDSLILNHYSNTIPYIESDDIKLSLLYHPNEEKEHSIEGGSAVSEEDTEDEDDDEDLLSSVTTLSEQTQVKESIKAECTLSNASSTTPSCTTESSLIKKVPLSSSHTFLSPIQTYSPQLNLSLYSPSITTPVSSIRSKKNRNYPTSSLSTTFAAQNSCLKDTSTVQNPTNISPFIKKPLYSTPISSSIASTIKMDIRSPPQPSQSTSRFMNAFQRLRGSSTHRNQNVNTNSVTPAEILNVKPSPSKSSLADKIKNKFQQLDKKKRASVTEHNRKNNSILVKRSATTTEKSMPRSTSLSSISHWSSRLTANHNKSNNIVQEQQIIHSNSDNSIQSLKTSSSCSSQSSYSSLEKNNQLPTSFTLTKSISSHRIYKNNHNTTIDSSRPRQTLRAVNPNDSIRNHRNLKSKDEKKKIKSQVRFTKLVSVKETYSKVDYDRGSDPEAVCTRLTPTMAQQIKEELNAYKLHEMQVHEFSRVHTHFFL